MNIKLVQDPSRYLSTADYFKKVAPSLGVETNLTEGAGADAAIYFNKSESVFADRHILYERDPDRQILMDMPANSTFYTQYGGWSDDQVVLHAADPDIHKRTHDPIYDIVFCGRLYEEERKPFLENLKQLGFNIKIYGDGFKTSDYVDNMSDGRIILNFSERGEINRRIYEAMAIGCCVTDRVDHLDKVGEEGKHFFSFNKENMNETVKLLLKLSMDKKLTEEVAKASRKHIINHHTYKHRFEELIEKGIK